MASAAAVAVIAASAAPLRRLRPPGRTLRRARSRWLARAERGPGLASQLPPREARGVSAPPASEAAVLPMQHSISERDRRRRRRQDGRREGMAGAAVLVQGPPAVCGPPGRPGAARARNRLRP